MIDSKEGGKFLEVAEITLIRTYQIMQKTFHLDKIIFHFGRRLSLSTKLLNVTRIEGLTDDHQVQK